MRQGQQNRRGRGRSGRDGRKPQNPLARNYESSGPDVKIRGTAAHIAEKYIALSRDALSSGDMITAENYLQHAEHYNRIIMAAQAQAASSPADHPLNGANGLAGPRQPAESDGLGMETAAAPAAEHGNGQQAGSSRDSESPGRRRRRRTPVNGVGEDGKTEDAGGAADPVNGNGAAALDDKSSPDEAAA